MDTNNWRPAQGGAEPAMETADWRTQLQPDSHQRIVNKIMDTLKRHPPFSGQEGPQELKKIAVTFEEKVYTAATSQANYLRKISLKMLAVESKSRNTTPNYLPSNSATSENPTDYAGKGIDFLVLLFLGCSMIFGARKRCVMHKKLTAARGVKES